MLSDYQFDSSDVFNTTIHLDVHTDDEDEDDAAVLAMVEGMVDEDDADLAPRTIPSLTSIVTKNLCPCPLATQ